MNFYNAFFKTLLSDASRCTPVVYPLFHTFLIMCVTVILFCTVLET